MKYLFTRSMEKRENKVGIDKKRKEGPKEETLEFLRQFARICHSESGLNSEWRVIVLN
ncbi:hypothetical protein [Parabacteroides sp. Marseille-P3160]|uniref:hypothetical protein n=1 Tax=Parabacteroides sp. Marseille-P3160 TaxID=1917887 RepID=UPI00135CBCAA|nr:hypothetical protein [Parabacteroides sp. Marseille-P3160]